MLVVLSVARARDNGGSGAGEVVRWRPAWATRQRVLAWAAKYTSPHQAATPSHLGHDARTRKALDCTISTHSMLLDPKASYVLMGEGGRAAEEGNDLAGKDSPPPILHLKLSANVLEELMNGEEGAELSFKQGSDSVSVSVGETPARLLTSIPVISFSSSVVSNTTFIQPAKATRMSFTRLPWALPRSSWLGLSLRSFPYGPNRIPRPLQRVD